jgi:hypothetical protein
VDQKGGVVHDYLLGEMVRIRIDELQAEASRARVTRDARRPLGWTHYLGTLGVSGAPRVEGGGFSNGTVEEACCA